ncbi:hypothetical protein [Effusibacillus lacus]|uniref:Uncharacterized protein n=1 Tax=Effusibacillus lacus TaxID=1348429 RepID=A0A292YGX7_9BACL|nr:hypothetical protein [Effusibacillus lacus]TCS71397.1 hypothetical protein EDD64_12615 [Effusibacillus lacus]GAX89927.1 hypothetical protein EFBL_1553 [Effusibacillus lacus]
MIRYQYDENALSITEQKNENDIEFIIKIKDEDQYLQAIRQVRADFDHNDIHTDALFYTHPDHEYQVIVRKEYYIDFILCLFKHQLVKSLTWS